MTFQPPLRLFCGIMGLVSTGCVSALVEGAIAHPTFDEIIPMTIFGLFFFVCAVVYGCAAAYGRSFHS